MKFDGILILSDIDGTFYWKNSMIAPRNIEKIKYFNENGGHFAFASGRNHKDIFTAIPMVREIVNMPCVLCNGSYLYDIASDTLLNTRHLDGEQAVKMLAEVRKKLPKVGTRVTVEEGFLVPADDEVIKSQLAAWRLTDFAILKDFDEFDGKNWFKAVFYSDPETLSGIREIYEGYKDFFDLTTSSTVLFELQPRGVSKSYQIPYLREKFACKKLYAVGDYDNDAEMLEAADVAACPANASDRIKAISKLSLCHCADGAIADLIDQIEKSL